MVKKNWNIWEKDHSVEARTFDRVQKKLPEMESAKQLRTLIKKFTEKECLYWMLDVLQDIIIILF